MGITIDLRGLPETERLLGQYQGQPLQNRTRKALRAGAAVMRTELRAEASGRSDLPRTFRKTRTRGHQNPLGVSISPASPLSNIFEVGARGHTIAPKRGAFLTNQGDDTHGRVGGVPFFASGPVSHPGMAARPLIGPVFARSKDPAAKAAEDVLFEDLR